MEGGGSNWVNTGSDQNTSPSSPYPAFEARQPATAAQMASRNIRNAKAASRRRAPIQSTAPVTQSMSFGSAGNGGPVGGMFGGNVQAGSGSFNFNAGAPGLQVPSFPTSFGPGGSFGAGQDDGGDPRADTTGEEAKRAGKRQMNSFSNNGSTPSNMFGGQQSSFSGNPAQPNPFGNQQGHVFNASNLPAQADALNNPFSFQSSAQPASPGFTGLGTSAPASNIFAFNPAPPQAALSSPANDFASRLTREEPAPSNDFASRLSRDEPAKSIFSFGQTQTQPAQPASSLFNFGSPAPAPAPVAAQNQPSNSLFQFGQTSTNAATPGLFASSTPAQPSTTGFFGNSQTPSTSGTSFDNPPAMSQPASNVFTTGLTQSTSNLFGNPSANGLNSAVTPVSSQVAVPKTAGTSNVFGNSETYGMNGGSAATTTQATSNIFGNSSTNESNNTSSPVSSQAATSNLVGTSNLFGSSATYGMNNSSTQPSSQSTTTLFPQTKSHDSAPQQSLPAPNLFANLGKPVSSTTQKSSGLEFINSPTGPSKPLFGDLSKPGIKPVAPSNAPGSTSPDNNFVKPTATSTAGNLFDSLGQTMAKSTEEVPKAATAGFFANLGQSAQPKQDLFGNLNKPVEQAVSQPTAKTSETSSSSSSSPYTPLGMGGSSLFPGVTPQSGTSGAPSQNSVSSSQGSGTNQLSPMKPIDAPSSASQPPPSGMFPALLSSSPIKSNGAAIKSGNSMAVMAIADQRLNSRGAVVKNNATAEPDYDPLYSELAGASSISDEELEPLVPAKFTDGQKNEFYAAYRLRSLNKAIEKFFASVPFTTGLSNLIAYYNEKKVEILDRSSLPVPGSKRKYVDDGEKENSNKRSRQVPPPKTNAFQPHSPPKRKASEDEDENQENTNPTKRSRPETASISNVLKATQSQTQNTESVKGARESIARSHPQPLPPPASLPPSSLAATPSTKSKRKAEVQLTKDDYEKEEQEGRKIKSSETNVDANGSSTSNLFKGIVGTPAKASPAKKVAPMPGSLSSKVDVPRANVFGGLQIPKSPTKAPASPFASTVNASPSKAATTSTNMFAPKATFEASNIFQAKSSSKTPASPFASIIDASPAKAATTSTNMFAPKPTFEAPNIFQPKSASANLFASASTTNGSMSSTNSVTSTNMFGSKPSNGSSHPSTVSSSSIDVSHDILKSAPSGPPKFGSASGTVNFMAQFTAKAKDSEAESEAKRMARAMEDDLDSDEDEETKEQWKADWIAKRKAALDDYHTISKGRNGFVPSEKQPNSESSISSTSESSLAGPADQSATISKSLFTQSSRSPGNSGYSSRTSTPGPFGSGSGSVLDGPIASSVANIFGHLTSDTASDGLPDNESSSESEAEEDSENKDPNYVPGDDGGSGPATPVEETGPGIASAKKANLSSLFGSPPLNSGASADSASGTSTPGKSLSLFDRIQKHPNGEFVRSKSPEEENSQSTPKASNLFASLNKSSTSDQTWKVDSPIKFGSPSSSTPDNGANPKVSFTDATPSKASTPGLFASLNSNTKPPFSNLFGSLTPKASTSGVSAAAGFSFGAGPTPSLFPSSAASGATSRATTPGNTTDGASDYEDPDAEKHDQIDLTSGGPGEENEKKIFEVRAVAHQWDATSASFIKRGVGPLRVLKDKETGNTRYVLRADPSGKVILNKALLSDVKYKVLQKNVEAWAIAEAGAGLEKWLLQVKEVKLAEELAKVLEENK